MAIPSARPFLEKNPIVPVVVLDREEDALPTAKALVAGGITSAEVTFRTPVAAQAIAQMAQVEGITVGAGTVMTPEQANRAIDAGAQFLVSPGFSADVARVASEREVAFLPGIANPTDIMAALAFDLDVMKFFPAVPLGGLPLVKAMAAPFPQLKFMPTGGIGPNNIREWLATDVIASVGGSWMVTRQMVAEGRFDEITRLSAEAMEIVAEVRS
ncbi:bifunctional 4-hydroxy-2-oxoglutarate aldolase/2-dehydro-3-deoxy-phosphogluconate aldolase [Arcanobacterium bovis]|uniref:2-dehydro-3-deoxy-phosphogluconate aldolase n=1 Tax=Arcanobacterium bovis TaxID=2529275 RepID=A0A4Q9V296_9ACTO|nr:bifunctional 4-hydroxy-2-oxoglutarate aldolase/2-dehydro-3-deoxy-phosphogluconate aldolase [Arcanobacterium bovis]TBW22165.1 bifunctional 4-hydroxy-2-oxoglutarate aldolase/2-dehydro-3-deoxy-phosphogluconate aldolase [Arcanobacterium bovis]